MEKEIHLVVSEEQEGQRLDAFLASQIEGKTRSMVTKWIEQGCVLCHTVSATKSTKVHSGEEIVVQIPEITPLETVPQEIPLDIIYEDEDVIVINKPSGLVVHPAPGHYDGNTLVNALLYHCGNQLSGIGGKLRPGIVHRIDKDTSGLLMVAKNDFAHQSLSAQLSDHSLARTYECVVIGHFREDDGTINAPIGRNKKDRKKMAVVAEGKPAVTHFHTLHRYALHSHIRCCLETGRTHQIRVHMAYRGHPILGDVVYGNKKPVEGLTGQCLHATEIRFFHPRTGQAMTFSCPLPDEFQHILQQIAHLT